MGGEFIVQQRFQLRRDLCRKLFAFCIGQRCRSLCDECRNCFGKYLGQDRDFYFRIHHFSQHRQIGEVVGMQGWPGHDLRKSKWRIS